MRIDPQTTARLAADASGSATAAPGMEPGGVAGVPEGAEAGDPASRINGVVDVPRPNRVAGWAIDRADAGAVVTVAVFREGALVAEVLADAYRGDLERGGIGSGRYGFAFDLEPPVAPGFEFTVTARARAADGALGELRPVGRARLSDDPALRLAERCFAELVALRATLGAERRGTLPEPRAAAPAAARLGPPHGEPIGTALDRIEVIQARLETALARVEPAAPPRDRGLRASVGLALLAGFGSLGLGLWSMLG